MPLTQNHSREIAEIENLGPAMTGWRRDFHRHPELAFEENRTSGFVADRLREWGLDPVTGIGGTGIVAVIEGASPGLAIALRADMAGSARRFTSRAMSWL